MAAFSFSTACFSMSSTVIPSAGFGAAAITIGFPPRATILSPSSVAWSNDSLASSRKCSTIGFRVGPNTWNDQPRYFNADASSIPSAWFIAAITLVLSIESPGQGNDGSAFKFRYGLRSGALRTGQGWAALWPRCRRHAAHTGRQRSTEARARFKSPDGLERLERTLMEPLTLIEYTDPHSIWCWGCEPVLRRVEWLYPEIAVRVIQGGLFEDFRPMREYWTRMSGGQWKESVHTFFSGVAATHRMPTDADRALEAIEDFVSTYPACLAAKAGDLQGPAAGKRYLRRLREAFNAEGRAIHRREVQEAVAVESALDLDLFRAVLNDGRAERAFQADLAETKAERG